MPNWTYNQINARAEIIKKFMEGEDFDFNRIIPMPESLKIECGSITGEAIAYYLTERLTVPAEDRIHNYIGYAFDGSDLAAKTIDILKSRTEDPQYDEKFWNDLYEKGKIYVSNQDKYGFQTWYDWAYARWGTKWNACDTSYGTVYGGDDIVSFDTAWCAPYPIFEKICELYPDEKISFYCESEEGEIEEFENRSGALEMTSYAETVWDDSDNEYIVRTAGAADTELVHTAAAWLWEQLESASSDEAVDLARKECEEKFGVKVEDP